MAARAVMIHLSNVECSFAVGPAAQGGTQVPRH